MLYRNSGVDLNRAQNFVSFLKSLKSVRGIGEFSSSIEPDELLRNFNEPVILTSVDGIGTKLILGLRYDRIEGLAQDLFAMVFNDLAVYGAKPVFFLDYIATSKLDEGVLRRFFKELDRILSEYGIHFLGGETAELPGMLREGLFDIAGFGVGVTEKEFIERKRSVKEGDLLLALPSSGPHSNGYSLIRKIIDETRLDPLEFDDKLGCPPIAFLLKPTRIYVKESMELFKEGKIKAGCHVTGGGIIENLKRIAPRDLNFVIERERIPVHPIFEWIKEKGGVPEDEMWRVFNMGVGFIFVAEREVDGLIKIGHVEIGQGRVILK